MKNLLLSSLGAALLALASVSCGSSTSAAPGGDGGVNVLDGTTGGGIVSIGSTPLPCDVNAVVVNHCQSCHSSPAQNGAPMSLVTWEDFHALSKPDTLGPSPAPGAHVFESAETRIHDDNAPMPQPPNKRLAGAELATMDTWLNAGAPKGTTECVGDASTPQPDSGPPTVTCTTDNVKLVATSPWTMPSTDNDDYVCYSVNIPVDAGTNHIMAITPNVDNHKIVHHILLFQADPSDTSITTTPAKCNAGGSLQWRIVYGWAPGGGPMQTPPNVGFPYDSTTKWVVQVHYNNIGGLVGEKDSSGFSFCSTDKPVQYDSDVVAFGTQNINIPARSTLDQTCSLTVPALYAGIHLFAAFPHMHQTGTVIETEQVLPGGGIVDLGRNNPWNFTNQLWFPITATLSQGDVVKTRCAWQNSTANTITFGQNTENEMCYSFTAYYPRVTNSLSWALPAIQSSCAATTGGGLPVPDAGWSEGSPTDAGAGD